MQYRKFLEIIRFSINSGNSSIPDVDELNWSDFYQFVREQALVGVVFEGVARLGEQGVKPPLHLLMEWIATAEQIKQRNYLLNEESKRLTQLFENEGHRTVVLKGQANARLYPNPLCRQPGDIDIWVDGGEKRVLSLLVNLGIIESKDIVSYEDETKATKVYHHVHLPVNKRQIDVEVHFRPSSGIWNPIYNRRLQLYLEKEIHQDNLMMEEGFRVPSLQFALIMQLAHIQKHFLEYGVGLRQLVDYFFLLKDRKENNTNITETLLRNLGLWNMAGAVMWIMSDILGLDNELLIAPKNKRRGQILLKAIVDGGNFGMYSAEKQSTHIKRLRLLSFDPDEVIWAECRSLKMQINDAFRNLKHRETPCS